ncbi:MAG: electron transport complex subunit RsxD [Gammaproteobacteria bacterium]|nr:electron transport complex subunit RsxD [Gammaproteobacteria bacterium]NND39497.1 electron transport complex subunit RsxD [Pseudomonadales bacterium]NNM10704.1 electron transport complex subunit RsxD [Pseudomonadales bacterium]RZV55028.1 MAG: electron transport complex subunit RsxD [Pseudomonadales bacterium]
MALTRITSPHAHAKQSTSQVMLWVALATLPGVAAMTLAFGWGTITNIVLAIAFGTALEALAMALRKRPPGFYLKDYSALVTALLLGIALPPYSAWWIILLGMFFAIIIAKQLYGGMGYNPFNPAMVGYVVLLISFPVEMTRWAAPLPLLGEVQAPGLLQSFGIAIGGSTFPIVDGFTMATPLDLVRQNSALMISDLKEEYAQFGSWGGTGWEWANGGFLIGGLLLLYKRIYTWHAPLGMLFSLALLSAIFYDGGSSASAGSPLLHLFSGATMLGAWFIVTDPVSSAVSNRGRLLFGLGAGALVFIIRKWGNYPDAVAFAVLLMNFIAPLLDHYTQPRTYGHT